MNGAIGGLAKGNELFVGYWSRLNVSFDFDVRSFSGHDNWFG